MKKKSKHLGSDYDKGRRETLTVRVYGKGYIRLQDLRDLVDVNRVKYYLVEEMDDVFYLTLYDKSKKQIKAKRRHKHEKS